MTHGNTRVPTRVWHMGGNRVPTEYSLWEHRGTYPSMTSGSTRVPTRVCPLGVPGYLRLYTLQNIPSKMFQVFVLDHHGTSCFADLSTVFCDGRSVPCAREAWSLCLRGCMPGLEKNGEWSR